MPRRRMIDPEIWRNEKVGSLSDAGRLLFIGIFSQADDDGRLKASPRFLKASIFPYDKDKTWEEIRELRDQCTQLGLIRIYTNGKTEYLDIPGWHEHQHIRKDRYSPSTLPSLEESNEVLTTNRQPTDNQLTTNRQPTDNQLTTSWQPSIVKYSLIDHETLPKGKVGGEPPDKILKQLFDLWNSLGVIKHKNLTGDMTRALRAASRDFSTAEISQAMKNYAHIVNDEQCFFKYRWTLKDFLKRGLEKFLDLEVAQNNYQRGNKTRDRPLPTTEELEREWKGQK